MKHFTFIISILFFISCKPQDIVVSFEGLPKEGVKVTIQTKNNKTIEKVTTKEGHISFKKKYSRNLQKITFSHEDFNSCSFEVEDTTYNHYKKNYSLIKKYNEWKIPININTKIFKDETHLNLYGNSWLESNNGIFKFEINKEKNSYNFKIKIKDSEVYPDTTLSINLNHEDLCSLDKFSFKLKPKNLIAIEKLFEKNKQKLEDAGYDLKRISNLLKEMDDPNIPEKYIRDIKYIDELVNNFKEKLNQYKNRLKTFIKKKLKLEKELYETGDLTNIDEELNFVQSFDRKTTGTVANLHTVSTSVEAVYEEELKFDLSTFFVSGKYLLNKDNINKLEIFIDKIKNSKQVTAIKGLNKKHIRIVLTAIGSADAKTYNSNTIKNKFESYGIDNDIIDIECHNGDNRNLYLSACRAIEVYNYISKQIGLKNYDFKPLIVIKGNCEARGDNYIYRKASIKITILANPKESSESASK